MQKSRIAPLSGNAMATNAVHELQHPDWTFLSNHAHVLHCVFLRPDIRIRDIASKVLITERAVQRILVDLEREGYLRRQRVGRQNRYRLETRLPLRHPLEHHVQVGRLLGLLQQETGGRAIPLRRESATMSPRTSRAAPRQSKAGIVAALKKRPRRRAKLTTAPR